MASQKRILISAFEAFDGRTRNASAEAAKQLATQKDRLPAGLEIFTCLLPVETGRAAEMLNAEILRIQPDDVVSLGEAKRDAICLETTAHNERKFTIPDNS